MDSLPQKERPARIPLFPLDVVLLPEMPLPLHIFEPRYKTMIRRCLAEKIEFGMILAANQGIAAVGCTAEIVRKLRDYSDGRMDILTEGRAIFRLEELLDEKEYYEG
jgi:Lon protease-like protein